MWWIVVAGCSGPEDSSGPGSSPTGVTGDTAAPPPPTLTATLGPVATLTTPTGGTLHSHATVAWGAGDRYLVALASGTEPNTQALAQLFDADGAPVADAVRLNAVGSVGDKPDVEWDGARYLVGWTDGPRVALAAIDADGAEDQPGSVVAQAAMQTDAVDLAVQPGGAGAAIWTEWGGPGMGPDDGRIVWRGFDPTLAPDGAPKVADESSRKTADAAPLADGGFVGVWARDYDHPSIDGELVYEVWGRLYRGDGTAWTFRADDLDTAYPSRPAVAVGPDGAIAVSWRDKTEADGAGLGSGAYVRLFAPDATPTGASVALGPDHDGDRVVVGWAGPWAVIAWQETDPDGLPGVILSVVWGGPGGGIAVDRLAVHEPGGERDERPSIAVRDVDGGYEVVVVWEALDDAGHGAGLRARIVALAVSPAG